MASLAELRDALTSLGLSTSTGTLRGEARREALEQRLREARGEKEPPTVVHHPQPLSSQDVNADRHLSLSELRTALEARGLSTHTPGLKGEARRHALIQRLQNAATTPVNVPITEAEVLKSSRSSTSSYSAAGEFFFFETLGTDTKCPVDVSTIPALQLPKVSTTNYVEPAQPTNGTMEISSLLRAQLERELVELRNQLHEARSRRSQATSRRLQDAGFHEDLEKLSLAMARLENERQRLVRIAFAHELVMTTVCSGQPVELVQEDAIQLIDKQQERLGRQIQCVKAAVQLSKDNQEEETHDAQLVQAISRVERQLRAYSSEQESARSSTSIVSIGLTGESLDTHAMPVLTRCQSMPSQAFHDTWQALDGVQKQQLHQELQTTKSFRIQRDRVRVGETATHTSSTILAFTRYPPTRADKLGIKALFMEQSHRSHAHIRSIYEEALAAEPQHAVLLRNFARFLHEKCHDHDIAEILFVRAVNVDPHGSVVASYASFLHHRRHNYDEAAKWYTQALEFMPHDPQLLGNYASLLRKQAKGRVSQLLEAKELLTRALTIDKMNVLNRLRMCGVLEDLGETTQARQGYEDLMQEMDPTSLMVVHVLGNFANFLTRSGEVQQAKEMYQKGLELFPNDPLLQRNFSLLLRDYCRTPRL